MMKHSVISVFSAFLLSATSAQRVSHGPFVGDIQATVATRVAPWYCDISRVVGCVKYNHICLVEFVFGDDRCDPITAQSTRCPTQTDAESCDSHELGDNTITHFQGFIGSTDTAVAGLKFYSDNAEYLLGSDDTAFESGLQAVSGNIIGLKYERSDDFDFVGLVLASIPDAEVREALAASQDAKAELMEQYNEALASAAQAENRGDEVTAAEFDAEANRIYAQIVTANEDQAELIEKAEDDVLGMPLYAFIIAVAVIFIGMCLVLILVIRCCRKMKADKANVVKVEIMQADQGSEQKVAGGEYNTDAHATDVNIESSDNKPLSDNKVTVGY